MFCHKENVEVLVIYYFLTSSTVLELCFGKKAMTMFWFKENIEILVFHYFKLYLQSLKFAFAGRMNLEDPAFYPDVNLYVNGLLK